METKILAIILSLIFISNNSRCQTFTSKLPIVLIAPEEEIKDDPKVNAKMKIIYRGEGETNSLDDRNTVQYLNYNGQIAIEIRGSSSQLADKKAYGFETRKANKVDNNNVSLLNLPSENDWILNGLAFDPTLLHDYIAYNLFRELGNYGSRTVFCEAFLNNSGGDNEGDYIYLGVYVLQEKIKIDGNRVDIVEMSDADNTSPGVTGGYIIKADKTTGGDPVAFVMDGNMINGYNETIDFIYDTPEPAVITPEQKNYINPIFTTELKNAAAANNSSIENGFPSIIDIPSFIDFMLINELSSCPDAYRYSTYYHKDRNGKLRAGPVWDFNYGFGIDPEGRSLTSGWQFENGNNEGPAFIRQIFYNADYRCYLARRWNEMIQPNMPLNVDRIDSWIETLKTLLTEPAAREEAKWHTIGNFNDRISSLKTFIRNRSTWMSNNIGSFSACSSPVLPELVINEIMYNPASGSAGEAQEFIEIKNNGTTTADLTGLYFSKLGLVYQFPANSSLEAGSLLVLASNAENYQTKYGVAPFGQFTRNLSNKSQKIVLSDAYGNTIDVVEYFDSGLWPSEADGHNKSLELKSPELDNNVGTNWSTGTEVNGSPGVDNYQSLPVTLIDFKGISENNSVVLSWDVAEEVNADHYTVEHSRTGRDFTKIGSIKTSHLAQYTMVHNNPVSGINYYRLKLVDMDGSYAYSKVIFVKVGNGSDFIFYPNPVHDKLMIDVQPVSQTRAATISIITSDGKIIAKRKVKSLGNQEFIDISKVPKGIYIINLETDLEVVSKRIQVYR